ncbi:hypothetical protein OQJ13_05065 [Legionella sp. PATHC035]|uniref:hypothetical protein n=1 Tax=Legionella sp. PATHC035 TaxID=2992040 RepID=UPI002242F58B|nr:hypothetical protein [Legionella sp. PATHC035]MCW8408341.1 hypothetical protein [Legionella sp. PATHC035]
MTIEKIEKGLNGLETGIEEVKLMTLELNKNNDRLQALIVRMEEQLNHYEHALNKAEHIKISNGELLNKYGILKPPSQQESLTTTLEPCRP